VSGLPHGSSRCAGEAVWESRVWERLKGVQLTASGVAGRRDLRCGQLCQVPRAVAVRRLADATPALFRAGAGRRGREHDHRRGDHHPSIGQLQHCCPFLAPATNTHAASPRRTYSATNCSGSLRSQHWFQPKDVTAAQAPACGVQYRVGPWLPLRPAATLSGVGRAESYSFTVMKARDRGVDVACTGPPEALAAAKISSA
jgi:hypothetical protein